MNLVIHHSITNVSSEVTEFVCIVDVGKKNPQFFLVLPTALVLEGQSLVS